LISPFSRDHLDAFATNMGERVGAGSGLWMVGPESITSSACAFLASEALRSEVATLLYPGDELIGRLRRLAAAGSGAVEREIYDRLATVELLVIDGLDEAASPDRFPEIHPPEIEDETDAELQEMTHDTEYRPGMTAGDLARLFAVIDERMSNLKTTVITTRNNSAWLEEELLCLPGEWPSREKELPAWNEPRRRHAEVSRLLSRLHGVGGQPISLGRSFEGGVRSKRQPDVLGPGTTRTRAA
jgi:hypothetical protein